MVQGRDVEGVGHGDGEDFVVLIVTDGQQAVAAGQLFGHPFDGGAVGDDFFEVDAVFTQQLTQGVAHGGFGDEAEPDEDFAQGDVLFFLFD